MRVAVIGAFLVVLEAAYEQSRWLGDQGWWYFGPRSTGSRADALRALGLTGHLRYLPVSEVAIASKVLGEPSITWDADARAIVEGAAANAQASAESVSTYDVVAPEGLSYRPYQRAGVRMVVDGWASKGTLIGDEMGLGKTMQAIGAIAVRQPKRVLVLCLTSIRENWRRELCKWLPSRAACVATSVDEMGAGDAITVTSYSSLQGPHARAKALRAALASQSWDLVVLDEAHVLKNEKAQISKTVLGAFTRGVLKTPGVVQKAAHTLILTGTPIQNKVRESLPLLRAVGLVGNGAPLGNEGKFLYRYCGQASVWTGSRTVTTFDGATNLSELQLKLRSSGHFVRRLKADVAKELPPKLRSLVLVGSHDDGYGSVAASGTLGFEQAVNLAQKTMSFEELSAYRAQLAKVKAPLAVEHVSDLLCELEPDGKVLVFAHHQTLLDALQAAFPASIRIDGSTPAADRQGLVDRFQSDPAVRIAILSTRAAGTGLNLTAASVVVFAEADWNPAMCVQAEDRAHRIGQTAESVTVQYLALNGTLDARVIAVMAEKMNIADAALDKVSAPIAPAPEAPPPAPPAPAADDTVTVTAGHGARAWTVTLTGDQRKAIAEALVAIASVCDGAKQDDDMGFNGRDANSEFVESLVRASRNGGLSPKMAAWGQKILHTYRYTQVEPALVARIWGA